MRFYQITIFFFSFSAAYASESYQQQMVEELREAKPQIPEKVDVYKRNLVEGKTPSERSIAALTLGVHYARAEDFKSAFQYLTTAKHLASRATLLHPIINLHLAYTSFGLNAPEIVLKHLKKLNSRGLHSSLAQTKKVLTFRVLFALGMHKKIIKEYRRSRKKSPDSVLKLVAMAAERTKKKKLEIDLLEKLSASFPLTPESAWAFQKLVKKSCDGYTFSDSLLRKLARNQDLDQGLTNFLKAQIKSAENQAQKIIDFRLAKKDVPLNIKSAPRSVKEAITLARIKTIQGNNGEALKILLQAKPRRAHARRELRERIAYTLHYLSEYDGAASAFGRVASITGKRSHKWHHFWNHYMAKNYGKALDLLRQKKRYVFSIDPRESSAPTYWQARILERLGYFDEAMNLYRKILRNDSESYYANLALIRNPDLWGDQKKKTAELSKTPKMFASNIHKNSVLGKELKTVSELFNAGLETEAFSHFRRLPIRNLKDQESLRYVGFLAGQVNDYSSAKRLAMRKIRGKRWSNIATLRQHQRNFQNEWRLIYPLAYQEHVSKFARILNVNELFLQSIIRAESRYQESAVSSAGAYGLMQILPKTAVRMAKILGDEHFKVEQLFSSKTNIAYGSSYIRFLQDNFKHNLMVVAAAYNAGPKMVNTWLARCKDCEVDEFVENITYRETRRYVKEVMRYFGHYSRIYQDKRPMEELPALPSNLPSEHELF